MLSMILIIFSFVFCALLLDFALIGYFPSKLGIWPSLNDYLVNGDVLIEDSAYLSVRTNIKGNYVDSMVNNRIGYKSLILTPKYLIVKNTYFTSLLNIKTENIVNYFTKRGTLGKKIVLNLKVENQKKYLKFNTKKVDDWISAFSRIGIKKSKE